LRDLLHFAEQLRSRSLIEAGLVLPAENADGLKQAQGAKPVGVGGVFRGFKRDLHVRLGREIVDLVRLGFLHDADDIGCVGDIAIMKLKRNALLVRIMDEMVDALGVEGRRTALHAVDDISPRKQKFGEIRAILSGCAGDERHFTRRSNHYCPTLYVVQSTTTSSGSRSPFWKTPTSRRSDPRPRRLLNRIRRRACVHPHHGIPHFGKLTHKPRSH
jgi:hypothetical protein